MNPELHAFFLDPSASGHFLHAELSAAYRRACEQAGAQHELIAYTDQFDFLLDEIRDYLSDENAYPEYTSQLADLRTALTAIDARRAEVNDLHIEVRQSLEEIEGLRADYNEGLRTDDDHYYQSWREARARTLAQVERRRADPDMVPHLDRVLTNLPELANMATPATLAEAARTSATSASPTSDELTPAESSLSTISPPAPETAPLETAPEPPRLVWAGIGTRGDKIPIPPSVLADMTELARRMAADGWHLSSGGADGSDTAFANGTPVEQRTIWLPWPGYNDLSGPDCHPIPGNRLQQALELAERFHPTWEKCKQGARKLHARNGLILLGRNLDRPVHAVVAYTQGGQLQGGTAQGLRIAMEHNIPIFNLGSMTMEEAWKGLQELRRSLTAGATARNEGMARVLHLRNAPPDAIRIDRRTRWGNPFIIGPDGTREEVIAKYRDRLWNRVRAGDIAMDDLAGLHGKDLACHCAPQPCHGDVLAKAAAWAHADRNRTESQSTGTETGQQPHRQTEHTYDPAAACVFRTTRGEWGLFSNFAALDTPISAAKRSFATSEHLYQAAKFGQSPEIQTRIAGAASARDATRIGRNPENAPDNDWNARKIDAMRWVIRMKREANPGLVDAALEKTGDLPIVESSSRDGFWGALEQDGRLVGRNLLGRLWMELRQQLRDGDPRALASSWGNPISPQTAEHDTWQRIKASYTSLYRASGDRIHHLPYQEGFGEFRDLLAGAVQDGSCPSRHADRLKALHHTVQTQDNRHNTVLDAQSRLDRVHGRLEDLKEKMAANPGHAIETMPGYTAWLRDRDAAVENWRQLAEDPPHREHMQIVAPDMMAPRIAELSEGQLPSIHRANMDHPVPASGRSVYTPSLQPLSQVYSHALAFVDRDPNLLAYAPQFDELKDAVTTALDECRHAPDLLDKLTTLRTTLDDSHERMTHARAVTEDIANASRSLCRMKSWSESTGRPIHEAPNFKTCRADADRALRHYEAAQKDPALALHLARADTLGVLAETALPLLQDSRFREPVASGASVAAARQRSEQAEEQFSMSA